MLAAVCCTRAWSNLLLLQAHIPLTQWKWECSCPEWYAFTHTAVWTPHTHKYTLHLNTYKLSLDSFQCFLTVLRLFLFTVNVSCPTCILIVYRMFAGTTRWQTGRRFYYSLQSCVNRRFYVIVQRVKCAHVKTHRLHRLASPRHDATTYTPRHTQEWSEHMPLFTFEVRIFFSLICTGFLLHCCVKQHTQQHALVFT